ncbi:flavin reductase like domain-containing protein [Stachybotrys elegans]|uniref:Flavin reductase like domain-containing protein n=1 Tax=Stachybotrys elegans TaxID=80388 RepID=A0A8K0SJ47_9HYPO|nr:flavin reductase like domain-containing protein [Stachybotrys elegans]
MRMRSVWLRGHVRRFCVLHTLRDAGRTVSGVLEVAARARGQSLATSRVGRGMMLRQGAASTTSTIVRKSSSMHSSSLAGSETPTAHPDTTLSLPEQLRGVMRLLPHSVVVCTTTDGKTPRGMTMSSFTSLTLAPTPLVTFNIASPSRTLDGITSSGEFNIHIMGGDTAGAQLAERFTRGNAGSVFEGVEWEGESEGAAPVLRGEGVLYVLRCRVLGDAPSGGLVRVRDHTIVVGEVVEVVAGREGDDAFGLAYADRRYRRIGGMIQKHV